MKTIGMYLYDNRLSDRGNNADDVSHRSRRNLGGLFHNTYNKIHKLLYYTNIYDSKLFKRKLCH